MSEVMSKTPNESVVIDLKVNRDLLNPNFDCYRISIEPIVTYSERLDTNVNELKVSDDEYSYLHLSMASHFNHIFCDPFSSQTIFFATNLGQIVCVSIELISGKLTKPKTIYSIPDYKSGLISVSFPSSEFSLISKSNQNNPMVYLLSTPSRSASEPWILLSAISLSDSEYNIKNRFQLFCSQTMDLFTNCLQIDFILCFVEKRTENSNDLNKNSTQSSFVSVLNWFTIAGNTSDSKSWNVKRFRRMIGTDWPKYVSFDFNGSPLLCLISDKDFVFVYDSEQTLIETNSQTIVKNEHKLLYTYNQTLEDITINFKLPVHITKNDICIDLKTSKLVVKIKDLTEFEGEFYQKIDSNSMVWTIQPQQDFQLLEITFDKSDKGMIWKELIIGDKNCMEIINNEMFDEIHNKLIPLTHEIQESDNDSIKDNAYDPMGLEECDYVDNYLTFCRFNGNTHSITHRIDLSGNQWLFTIPIQKSNNCDTNELPYFVVRHDVDALVWAPQSTPCMDQFKVTHLATFAAFGYVQASKTNTRFIVASNDFSFVAIADTLRHVYVYKQPTHIQSGEVRNRKTGQEVQTIANQYVINLNDCHSIIGIHATNDSIFVLSCEQIFLIKT